MIILNEHYYRKRIRPEHWDEFTEMFVKAESPAVSVAAQANLDRLQHNAEIRIRDKYPDAYGDDSED